MLTKKKIESTYSSEITNYAQSIFSFRKTSGNIKQKGDFVKMGETGNLNTPVFKNLYTDEVYYQNEQKEWVFINSTSQQFFEIAEEIKKFDAGVEKICEKPNIIIQRIDKHQKLDKEAFNQHILPFLNKFSIEKSDYFERFFLIVEKFTAGDAWQKNKPPFAYEAYQKWKEDGSLIKLWQNSRLVEKHLNCKVFDNNMEKVNNLLFELNTKLQSIDEKAFEKTNYFWPSSLFSGCYDLTLMFPDSKYNPLYNWKITDFTTAYKNKKVNPVQVQEDEDLPF